MPLLHTYDFVVLVYIITFIYNIKSLEYTQKSKGGETSEHILAMLKVEKEELESSFNNEKLLSLQLKQELADAEARNTDLYKVVFYVYNSMSCSSSLFQLHKFGKQWCLLA